MRIKEKLELEDFKRMSLLEKKFYDSSHIAPFEETYDWYRQYPYSSRVMEADGELVGFVDMFPIDDEIFHLLKCGKFNDKELTSEHIIDVEKTAGKTIHMFLCCLAIDEKYRKSGALKALLKAHLNFYQKIQNKGTQIDFIITDNVTESGERFSKRMGFEKVADTEFQSVVYMLPYDKFERAVKKMK